MQDRDAIKPPDNIEIVGAASGASVKETIPADDGATIQRCAGQRLPPPPPHGQRLVASFRADRLSQRAGLREQLRLDRVQLRLARQGRSPGPTVAALQPGPDGCEPGSPIVAAIAADDPETTRAACLGPPVPEPVVSDPVAERTDTVDAPFMTADTTAVIQGHAHDTVPDMVTGLHPLDSGDEKGRATETAPSPNVADRANHRADKPAVLHAEYSSGSVFADLVGTDAGADPIGGDPVAECARSVAASLREATGLGPVMCIRLEQLGYISGADLAQAEPAALRAALGDISRLLDIEGWIERAKRAAAQLDTHQTAGAAAADER